jgi:hypothetical protein
VIGLRANLHMVVWPSMMNFKRVCLAAALLSFAACSNAGSGGGGGAGGTGGGGSGGVPGTGPIDLCKGLVQDKDAHPMTAIAQPALGQRVTDAEFHTTIQRITQVAPGAGSPAFRPLYSTVSAWNADESRLLLFDVQGGGHQLYNGKTYAPLGGIDIHPADIEQVYWHTTDPDILFYVDGKDMIRYHVAAAMKETLTTFSFCSAGATGGSDPMFTSFDSNRIGLKCGDQLFIYDIGANKVLGPKSFSENPAQASPSGKFGYLSDSGRVTDTDLNVLRTLDLKEPFGHASMGQLPTGEDTWNGQVFDPGPKGDDDIGNLVTFNLNDGSSRTIIGPKTGWPYPPDGHISAMAIRQPGWMVVSTYGDTSGKGLLDLEITVADTTSGAVCRAGRHRSWGRSNTHLAEPYWAEAHATPSPKGTRIVFASDWGNQPTVDAYVLELPSYTP